MDRETLKGHDHEERVQDLLAQYRAASPRALQIDDIRYLRTFVERSWLIAEKAAERGALVLAEAMSVEADVLDRWLDAQQRCDERLNPFESCIYVKGHAGGHVFGEG